jgi:hypothetical protein
MRTKTKPSEAEIDPAAPHAERVPGLPKRPPRSSHPGYGHGRATIRESVYQVTYGFRPRPGLNTLWEP